MAKESIESLAKSLAESLPEGLRSVKEDAERNFRAVLASGIDRMDLVTREEFEVQKAVLDRTREKLVALEERLSGLEDRKAGKKKPAGKKTARKSAGKKRT